jgi:hypothetical protein
VRIRQSDLDDFIEAGRTIQNEAVDTAEVDEGSVTA